MPKETGYTKGNWEVGEILVKGIYVGRFCITANNIAIADVWERPNSKANVNLIAAAPDMFEALKKLRELRAKPLNFTMQETEKILEDVDEAIAKAK